MRRLTFMILTAFIAVAAFAAGPQKRDLTGQMLPGKAQIQLGQKLNLKQASREMLGKVKSSRAHAPKKAVEASALVGDYTWDYLQANEMSTDLENLATTAGSAHVTIAETESGLTISGMFSNDLEATIESDEDGDWIVIAAGQTAGTYSSYGDYVINGIYYYEGDEEYEAGWYYSDIYGQVLEDGSIYFGDWMCRVLSTGDYAGYSLSPYYVEGSTLTPADPLAPVTVPEGLTTEEYSLSARNYDDDADVSGSVFIGFDGNDVYVQGFCTYLPEAWVKGTLEGTTITFATGQYFGIYADTYDMFLNVLMGEDVVFDYDAEAGTLTAQNEFFLVDNSQYYFDSYRGAVLKKVIEKAAMPANPAITALQNTNYGWAFAFNVPTVDVNGDGLATSKLYYMIYTDIEGEIAPLTFTPATHTKLTEDLTEIPFGFTEGWDIYDNRIYLNELYSADWNNLGIQSIYYGGDETNATEIQWFHIKDYFVPVTGDFTFDFNAMDVAVSTQTTKDGDITETVEFTAGNVTLAISPKEEGKTTENRFWSTTAGPQLRVYSGTLTFTVPKEYLITGIQFNHNGKWGTNTVNEIAIPNDTENNVATWTPAEGEELTTEVVVAIAANSQINSIVVTVDEAPEAPEEAIDPDGLTYTFEDGTLEGWTAIDADGDGYNWKNTSEAGSGLTAHGGSNYAVYSQSYDKSAGPLTPDNYLVSPKVKLGSTFSFFAVAQDASYPVEHFGVFVSTTGKNAEDFEQVEVWDLKAVRHNAPRKVQGNWYQYIVDMSAFEGKEGYVAIRHFDCTDMFYMLVDDITFGEPAEPDPIIVNELVVLPEGVEPIEYTLVAEGYSQSSMSIEKTVNVAFDGADVYLQGLAYYFPDAYVKGTLNENGQVVVPTAQFVGEDNYGVEYIVALGVDGNDFTDEASFAFDLDAETGTLTLAEGNYYGESSSTNSSGLWDYFETATFTVGAMVLPEVVVAPEGLEADTWYLSCNSYNGKIRANELQVGVDGTDMYIQGLCEYLPEAWVKGTVDGNTVTFASGQFYGLYNDQYKLFFVGYTPETEEITDVVFTLDEEGKTMTTDQYIVLNGKADELDMYDYYSDVVISSEMPEVPEAVVAPEDLVTENYQFKGFDTYYEEEVISEAKIGFYGEDQVYFQGLSSYVPEAWVVGTIEDGVVTIPETYMGIFSGYFGDSEVFFSGTSFVYDAEAGTFTSEEGFVTYENPDDEYMMDEYVDVVLTKINDVAATPADPVITGIKTVGTSYPKVTFSIPLEDVDGNPLMQDKLYYQIFIEKEGEVTPVTFTTDLYEEIEEEMTVIPYGFSDGWDFYTGTVYLNQGAEEIATWTKIGIQTIYYGGGEVNKSNIVWQFLDTPVTVSEALYATYVAPCDVDFTESAVEAFTAVVNEVTGCVSLLPVTTVPAGTAVVVKATEAGTYATYKTTDAVLGAENELVAATEDVVADGTQFVLAKVDDVVGFYQVTTGTTVAAGKGYMTISSAVKAFYPIEGDDATGIFSINAGKNEVIYNLAGQRINKAQKGVNIINGKKILK